MASPRDALSILVRSLGAGLALGTLLHLTGAIRNLRGALVVCTLFSMVMWGGFRLLSPWFAVRPQEMRTPFRTALDSLGRILALYTALLLLTVGLVRLATGLNLLARPVPAALTFLVGLTITSVMTGLHTTQHLVWAERARAEGELETLRLRLLEADHARKTQELEEARELQLSMLPAAPPACCGTAFAYALRTATEVGGDTYDHRTLPGGGLLLAFGDATGHGLQAGLLVTAVKALFQTLPPDLPLSEQLDRIGAGVRSLHMPRMAMALVLLRLEGTILRFASAGMPPLLHHVAAEDRVEAHRTSGPPLGQLRSFDYREDALELAPGDTVLLASDGLPECLDPEGRMLGYDRLVPLLERHASLSPEDLAAALVAEAETWGRGRPLADDLSLLVVRQD